MFTIFNRHFLIGFHICFFADTATWIKTWSWPYKMRPNREFGFWEFFPGFTKMLFFLSFLYDVFWQPWTAETSSHDPINPTEPEALSPMECHQVKPSLYILWCGIHPMPQTTSMLMVMKTHVWWFWGWFIPRKFRSQTSDNMDRWKAEMERVREKRRVEERRAEREDDRRERDRRKKMQVHEKVGKSRNIMFFQWFVAPEGRKVGSLKRRVRSQLARWEMKKCTLLWREAHFQVKMYKTHHSRTTFGSWDVEKVHAVVARSTFRSQNVQRATCSRHF